MIETEQQQVRHVLLIEDQQGRRIVSLEAATYTLGRDRTNAFTLNPKPTSSQQALLLRISAPAPNYFFRIIDGDLSGNRSSQGLVINGDTCIVHDLQSGDLITLGEDTQVQYFAVTNLSDAEFSSRVEAIDFASFQENFADPLAALIPAGTNLAAFNDAALVRLASIPELSPYSILELDLTGKITYLNPTAITQFKDIAQISLQHPLLNNLLEGIATQDQTVFVREVAIAEQSFAQTVHYLPESSLIRSYVFDISERKREEERIRHQALHDALTGLPNRLLFNDRLALALAHARRTHDMVAVMYLDLDRFKTINDTLNHALGDRLLQLVAERLLSCLRRGDTAARWGGDEFILLLPNIDCVEDVTRAAERILDTLRLSFTLEEHELYITSSIGIALYPHHGLEPKTLINQADAALYRAKAQGRNTYQFHPS